jgi:hypothetical protein
VWFEQPLKEEPEGASLEWFRKNAPLYLKMIQAENRYLIAHNAWLESKVNGGFPFPSGIITLEEINKLSKASQDAHDAWWKESQIMSDRVLHLQTIDHPSGK